MNKKSYATRAEANRANAEHSTGPRSEEGKRIAAHNALKTGLTGRTVVLPTDSLAEYQAHLARVHNRYHPKTEDEQLLTESIAHSEWRLLRIPTLETGLLAVGREECADLYPEQPLAVRIAMIDARVHLAYGKQLANLALQEARLHRRLQQDTARLEALLKTRHTAEQALLTEAAFIYERSEETGKPFPLKDLSDVGFECSLDQIQHFVARRKAERQHSNWPTLAARCIHDSMRQRHDAALLTQAAEAQGPESTGPESIK